MDGVGYEASCATADAILAHARRTGDTEALVRGQIRRAYAELHYGKWRGQWKRRIAECEELVRGRQSLAVVEYLALYGHMKGCWLGRLSEGLNDIRTAAQLANRLACDGWHARARSYASRLLNMTSRPGMAMNEGLHAFAIAMHQSDPFVIETVTTRLLVAFSVSHESLGESGRELARSFVDRAIKAGARERVLRERFDRHFPSEARIAAMQQRVDEILAKSKRTLAESKLCYSRLQTLAAQAIHERKNARALALSQRSLEFALMLEDGLGARITKVMIAKCKARLGRRDIDVAGLPAVDHPSVSSAEAFILARVFDFLGDQARADDWRERARDQEHKVASETVRQSAATAEHEWQAELRSRASVNARLAEKDRYQGWILRLIAVAVFLVAVPFAWRYRERSRHYESMRREVERREGEEKRSAELRKQLAASQRLESIGTLAAGVAHEFNNSLAAIVGYTDLARLEISPEERDRNLRAVLAAAEMAMHTTRGLLTFARSEEIQRRSIEIVSFVSSCHEFCKRVLPASVRLGFEARRPPPIFCSADGGRLQQVLLNLVINARDAIFARDARSGRGTIRICVDADEHEVIIEVWDDGCGIPEDALTRIFEPFYSTKDGSKGTGLGLAIVHGLIADHGGTIRASSAPGDGTTMTIRLPRAPAGEAVEVESYREVDGAGRLLLVAEDDPAVRAALTSQLEVLSFRVKAWPTGVDFVAGFEACAAEGQDIAGVVLDIDLPELDGPRCLEIVQAKREAPLPALFVSGRERATDVPGARFLAKPVSLASLGHALAMLLDDEAQPV